MFIPSSDRQLVPDASFLLNALEKCFYTGIHAGLECSGQVDATYVDEDGDIWIINVKGDNRTFTAMCMEWWWQDGALKILCDHHGLIIVTGVRPPF